MLVKNIMIPQSKLTTVSLTQTVEETIQLIDDQKLLSLPVVDGTDFVGVISKKYIYEKFFNLSESKDSFMKREIKEFMQTKIESVNERDLIEVPAEILTHKNLQFIPVKNEKNEFTGIVTHKAIFNIFNKMLGIGHTRLEIITKDLKGRLALLTEIIAKQDVNIISIAEVDIEVMDLREIILRVDTKHVKQLVAALEKGGFRVKRVDEEK